MGLAQACSGSLQYASYALSSDIHRRVAIYQCQFASFRAKRRRMADANTHSAVTKVEIVPVCVNVGDAIFICIEYGNGHWRHCYLVDGSLAAKSKPNPNKPAAHLDTCKSCSLRHGRPEMTAGPDYNRLHQTYKQLTMKRYELRGIIVTHPDQDHYQGITNLLQDTNHNVHVPILITNQFLQKFNDSIEIRSFFVALNQSMLSRNVQSLFHKQTLNRGNKTARLPTAIFPNFFQFSCEVDVDLMLFHNHEIRHKNLPQMTPQNVNDNRTSIITTVLEPGNETQVLACLTGDAEMISEVDMSRALPTHPARLFQVPHHGSSNNSSEALYRRMTDQSIYLISCGTRPYGGRTFPHKEVLQRIFKANAGHNNRQIRIILTSNRHLDLTKMEGIGAEPRLLIYYWDEYIHKNDPYLNIPLFPVQAPNDLIASIPNLIEWSIEGYTNMVINRGRMCRFFLEGPYWRMDHAFFIGDPRQHFNYKFAIIGITNLIPPPHFPSLWRENTIVLIGDILKTNNSRLTFLEKREESDGWYISQCCIVPWQVTWLTLNANGDRLEWSNTNDNTAVFQVL